MSNRKDIILEIHKALYEEARGINQYNRWNKALAQALEKDPEQKEEYTKILQARQMGINEGFHIACKVFLGVTSKLFRELKETESINLEEAKTK